MLQQLLEHRGVSIYQDLVEDGRTIRAGRRDCAGRWQAIAPHLPASGTLLDIGSNFGWFGLMACQASPRLVVASVEADEETANFQRHVLASHRHERIVLLTRKASAAMARDFASAGQQFDAVFCLSVLHWMPDHEDFLRSLTAISQQIFIELPDPTEDGAGIRRVRQEIGQASHYLRQLFPQHRRECLSRPESHRDASHQRELWLVERSQPPAAPSEGLDVATLLRSSPAWPARSWWQRQIDGLDVDDPMVATAGRTIFTPDGLIRTTESNSALDPSLMWIKRRILSLPETGLLSRRDWAIRRLRGAARRVLR